MQGMSCEGACACEIHSGKCAECACVRPFFGRAMCDRILHTFAHFLGQNYQKCYVLELLWNIFSCFGSSFPVLEHLILF